MTSPHPQAVGSLGGEACGWVERELDIRLWWWQRLVMARFLEVDTTGALVWLTAVLSTPRQVGKSWLLRALALWRLHQAGRFGEEQTVLHIAQGLGASREVQRNARLWAKSRKHLGYGSREQNGAQEVSTPDGSRWLVRDQRAAYSYSVSMALVDEAWGVEPNNVNEGLFPTLAQRVQPAAAAGVDGEFVDDAADAGAAGGRLGGVVCSGEDPVGGVVGAGVGGSVGGGGQVGGAAVVAAAGGPGVGCAGAGGGGW